MPDAPVLPEPTDETVWETGCRGREDGIHCPHWYDDEAPCCGCGDDGENAHGDHYPSLDCVVCHERIADERTTLANIYELAERRYKRFGQSFGTPWRLRPIAFGHTHERSHDG